MTPRPWVKRECSAVGKTQRALWSWLIRRSRWTQARVEQVLLGDVLGGQPGGRGLGRRQALGQLDVAVDRVADQVDRGERVAAASAVGLAPRSARRPAGCVAATSSRSDGRREDLDVVAPRRIQSRTSIVPGDRRPPEQRAVGLGRRPAGSGASGASWTRLATFGAKRRTTSTGSWSAMMSQARSNIPSTLAGRAARTVRASARHVPDPLDLERPDRVARLVPPDQVERVGLERRLDAGTAGRAPSAARDPAS